MNLVRRIRTSAILPTPDLPPEPDPPNCDRILSHYVGPDFYASYPNGSELSNPMHKCFENVSTMTDPGTGDETSVFDAVLEGMFDDGSGSLVPVVLTGPVRTVVRGKGGADTGAWQTEILSMDLSGDVGKVSIAKRESPIKKSKGKKKSKELPSGDYRIDGFFDVFTELSIDGGPFMSQMNPGGRLVLERILPKAGLPSPGLPPESDPPNCDRLRSRFSGRGQSISFPNGIDLTDPTYRCFKNAQVTIDPGTGDETQTVESTLAGIFDDGSGPQPVTLTGPVTTVARAKGGATTGSWDTEIVSMSLSGDVGGISIEIRESPKLKSPGKKEVKDKTKAKAKQKGKKTGEPGFVVDGFFDVFTEISIDGGPFQPQISDAARLELQPIRPSVALRHPEAPPEPDPPNCDRLQSQFKGGASYAVFPGGVQLSDPLHRCFKNVAVQHDVPTGDLRQDFDSTMEATIDLGSGPETIILTGPVTTIVRGKGTSKTGSWETEILSMSLSGDVKGVSIDIRKKPGKKSSGRKKVEKDESKKSLKKKKKGGGDRFVVDSFFDVFTEISIDGGPFQSQINGAGRLDLLPIRPSVVRPDASLPPEPEPLVCAAVSSRYEVIGDQLVFPNGIDFTQIQHKCFSNVVTSVPVGTDDESASFDSIITAIVDDGSGPQWVELSGPAQTIVRGRGTASTGRWDTEMVSLSLVGDVGGTSIEIRESPVRVSPGKSKISDNGDGTFQVDSFFDVFTEISVGGGPFQPQTNEAVRFDLSRARPPVFLPQPDLPPEPDPPSCNELVSLYGSPGMEHFEYPGGFELSEPIHKCFDNVQISTDPGTGDETQMFDSTLTGFFDLGTGPQPVVLSGTVRTRTLGKDSQPTGVWDTEMLSMSLSGDVGGTAIDIRESPNKKSEGKKKVKDIGGGQYAFDSFFDVFVEVSIDGGPFMPQLNEAVRLELRPVPEPAQWLVVVTAIPLLRWMARRRRR
jgi:hypothetical protein